MILRHLLWFAVLVDDVDEDLLFGRSRDREVERHALLALPSSVPMVNQGLLLQKSDVSR